MNQKKIITSADSLQDFYRLIQADLLQTLKRDPVIGMLHKTDAQYMKSILTMANPDHQEEKIRLIESKLGISLKNKRVLEIGSGLGDFVATARRHDVEAYGVEPHNNSYGDLESITLKFMSQTGIESFITRCEAESLPHESANFDVVFSYYVLEHVKNPHQVLRESLRILKPGGLLFFVFPNYGSFWEGHYGVPWLPFANKTIGKLWIRLWGYEPDFIDTLQLINLIQLKGMLKELSVEADVVSLGKEAFIKDVSELSFTSAGSLYRAKALLEPLKKLGILAFAAHLTAAVGMYTPFYLTLKKK